MKSEVMTGRGEKARETHLYETPQMLAREMLSAAPLVASIDGSFETGKAEDG